MTLRLSSPTKMQLLSRFLSFSAVLLGVLDHLLFMVEGVKVSYGADDRQFIEVYPCSRVSAGKPTPLLVFLHGGAWYSGSTTDHHDLAQYISTESDISVVLIEYRLTLEGNKIHHPDHLEDVYQALDLIFRQSTASRFGYNTSKSIFAGHSVGGYMVNAAALASDQGQSSYTGPIRNMPKLDKEVRQVIKAFVAVESIFSIVDLLHLYPTYLSFVQDALYPQGVQPVHLDLELKKAGLEAWPVDPSKSHPIIYVIHSSEDTLLGSEYNAQGIKLLQEKGLEPIIDLTSFKGDHDDLLHTEPFWQRLIKITHDETSKI